MVRAGPFNEADAKAGEPCLNG